MSIAKKRLLLSIGFWGCQALFAVCLIVSDVWLYSFVERVLVSDSPFLIGLVAYGALGLIFYGSLLFHELGHAVCGWLTGFSLVGFGLGKWVLLRKDGQWLWQKKVIGKEVAAYYMGVKTDPKDQRFLLMIAGGLLSHFLLILVFTLVGWWTGEWRLYGALALPQLAFLVINVYPFSITDGRKMLELYRHPEYAALLDSLLRQSVQLFLDPEGSNLKDYAVEGPVLPGHLVQVPVLVWAQVQMMEGNMLTAKACLEELLAQSDNDFILKEAALLLLEVCLHRKDWEGAQAVRNRREMAALLAYPKGNNQAIAALYHLRVSKDQKALEKALKRGKKSLSMTPLFRDERIHYEELLSEIERENNEQKNAGQD